MIQIENFFIGTTNKTPQKPNRNFFKEWREYFIKKITISFIIIYFNLLRLFNMKIENS